MRFGFAAYRIIRRIVKECAGIEADAADVMGDEQLIQRCFSCAFTKEAGVSYLYPVVKRVR